MVKLSANRRGAIDDLFSDEIMEAEVATEDTESTESTESAEEVVAEEAAATVAEPAADPIPEPDPATVELAQAESIQGDGGPIDGALGKITLPIPESFQTTVELLCLSDPSGLWRSGYRVRRLYDCEPHDAAGEELPESKVLDGASWQSLGEAILESLDRAAWWINLNSSDDDPNATGTVDAIDEWKLEFNADAANIGLFDAEPETMTVDEFLAVAATQASTETAAEAAAGEVATENTESTEGNPEAIVSDPVTPKPTRAELEEHYRYRKQEFERRISEVVMLQRKHRAIVKNCNDSLKSLGDELAELNESWEYRLRQLEREEAETKEPKTEVVEVATEITETTEKQESPSAVAAVVESFKEIVATEGNEPWRTVELKTLPGITEKLAEILEDEGIKTIGQWVDFPGPPPRGRGLEYRVIKGMTERRFEKISEAVIKATSGS